MLKVRRVLLEQLFIAVSSWNVRVVPVPQIGLTDIYPDIAVHVPAVSAVVLPMVTTDL